MKLVPGQSCGHPACLSHVRSACEGCGRRGGFFTPRTELLERIQDGFKAFAGAMIEYERAMTHATSAHRRLAPLMQELERQMEERDAQWRDTL